MKKLHQLAFVILLSFGFQTMYAQEGFDINFGVGVLPTFAKDKGKTLTLPLTINVAYKLSSKFSLGAYVGRSVSETKPEVLSDGISTQWRNNFTSFGIRAAAHTDKLHNWDIYGGMSLSYNLSRMEPVEGSTNYMVKHMGIQPKSGNFAVSGFLGSRYSLSKKLGLYGELGFGISILTCGLSLRL